MNNLKKQKTRMAANNAVSRKEYKQLSKKNSALYKILLTLFLIIIAFILICVSGVFDINEIIVEENTKISTEQIISFSGIQNGTNLFAVSNKDITKKLKENSYIESVKIKRILPDKIKLIVEERNADFILQLANSYVYINKQGYILEISNEKLNVPTILGFSTDLSNIKENDRLDESDLKKMNIVIKIMNVASNNELANLITKIDISDEKNYTIYLDTESKIAYLGNANELNTRFLYIKAILKEQQGKSGEIFVNTDLNSEYVYFKENI